MFLQYLSNLLLTLTAASAAHPTVDLGYAAYEGAYDRASNSTSFLGVRYAAPPTGALRWRPPQPPVPQLEVQQATVPPPACVQGTMGMASEAPIFMRGERSAENATLLE